MPKSPSGRREFLKAASATAAGVLLVACGASPPGAGEAAVSAAGDASAEASAAAPEAAMASGAPTIQDPQAISWWFSWSNLEAAVTQIKETDEFKQMLGSDTLEYRGGVDQEALLTALAGGTAPDGGSNYGYPDLYYRGVLLPVDDRIATSTIIKKDEIQPQLWDSAVFDGKMIGVVTLEGYMWWGLNYNAKAVADAGLDADAPPETWEEALEWHKALTKFDSAGNLQQFGLDPFDAMAGETDFASQSFGGENWWDEKNRKINLNSDAIIQAMDVGSEFIKLVGADKLVGMRQDQNLGGWGASYNAGLQDMIIEGYWHPGETVIQKPDIAEFNRSSWAPVPASRKGTRIMATGAHMVVLFTEGKHPDQMYKVAEFLATDQALDIIFKEVGWILGKTEWLSRVDPDAYPGLKFYIDAPDQVTEWIIGRRCPIHRFIQTQYTELREAVFRGTMTGQDAAAELQTRAEGEWQAQGLS